MILSAREGSAASLVGACVFAATIVLLYLTSTLYHGAIYLFIAGSYTPLALGALKGSWGWTLFSLVWSMAAMGILLKAFNRLSHPWLSTGLYLAMGWLVLIAAVPLVQRVPLAGVALLVAGGLAYTLGVVFFMLDHKVRYALKGA